MTRILLSNKKGQVHTLEAAFSAILLLSAVVFALQVTAVTPLTSSTSSQQIQSQQAATVNGFLSASAERDILKTPVLMWDENNKKWHNTDSTGLYSSGPIGTEFGDQLNNTFTDWGVAVNVDIGYYTATDASGDREQDWEPMVRMGTPSENAVSGRYVVTLYDDDVLYDASGDPLPSEPLSGASDFYAPDTSSTDIFNVLTVRVTAWRI